ncbi:YfbK domain-containing protein [Aliikangiella sp. IMCC44359]|uniref:YfbK domain-containing protein n=1 Tax=Aliikangiella sp. IMCC44359 TaxID=3459125 RepID=UPI00403AE385
MIKNPATTLKIILSAVLIALLANCASKEEQIIVVGSRIANTGEPVELVETAEEQAPIVDSKAVTPIQTKPVQTLNELSKLIKNHKNIHANSTKKREAEYLKEKEQLYHLIATSSEASHQIFKRYGVNPTIQTEHNPISTFSMDVDNGSYKLATAMLEQNRLPNPDGIRIEEFVNSINYQYNQNDALFSISAEAMPSPFRPGYHILHVGIQAKTINDKERNPSNLVLVADVSGSMASDNKLQLLKDAMKTLVSQLNTNDRIALVVYNENALVKLESTSASKKLKIFNAIDQLIAGGSTNAEKGLQKGYELAENMYQPGFNNRVILTSDGMANIGSTSPESILTKVLESKEKGIFLTTLGVGIGMFNDHLLEQLANQGNGNYLYIANARDIQEVFVDQLNSQLQTVAKDAKIQIKFNPKQISNYRLLGYENRHLNQQDFTDPNKDGGEVGAGHTVTALYEIKINQAVNSKKLADLSIAYKKPQGHKVHTINKILPVSLVRTSSETTSPDSRLSFSIAAFAEKLRQSYWARLYSYNDIQHQLNLLPVAYQKQEQVIKLKKLIATAKNLDARTDNFEPNSPIVNINFDRVPLLD